MASWERQVDDLMERYGTDDLLEAISREDAMETTKGDILDEKIKDMRDQGQHPEKAAAAKETPRKVCVVPDCPRPRATPTGRFCSEHLAKARVEGRAKGGKSQHAETKKTELKPEDAHIPKCDDGKIEYAELHEIVVRMSSRSSSDATLAAAIWGYLYGKGVAA